MNIDYKLKIKGAILRLSLKFKNLDVADLDISEYNKAYLNSYLENFEFYMPLYSQLLSKSILHLKGTINNSVFIDYGGGSGILSYLAIELGFKTVIYIDIFETSVIDTQKISKKLNYNIDHFIHGDVDSLKIFCYNNFIKPDLICSFDVLEHIYNLENWFYTISKIKGSFSICFMTSANSKNPFVTKRLKKLHKVAEFEGKPKTKSWKESDQNLPFLSIRKNILKVNFPFLKEPELEHLSKKTRGLIESDILNVIDNYIKSNNFTYSINHPTNTCDPKNGNWTEKLIHLNNFEKILMKNNMKVKFTNSSYSYSSNKILNLPKYILNTLLKLLGAKSLFLSPTYTAEITKNTD